jgi:hypothetical protein
VRGVRRVRLAIGEAIRSVPGGGPLLQWRFRTFLRARRAIHRVRPPRPPLHEPAAVVALSVVPEDESFITGNGIAARCRYALNFGELCVNEEVDNDWWFCRAEFLEYFFRKLAPNAPYVLFSHNSDRPVDERFRRRVEREPLVLWFARNLCLDHPKLRALPAGIANPRWTHGNQAAFKRLQQEKRPKTALFEVSFDVGTNRAERERCVAETGLAPRRSSSFEEYLGRLASSYFCISPNGNGIDCHRTWEALYVGTIPVVTRSVLTDQHADFPLVVLDDWSEFASIDFSPRLYEQVWGDWSAESLRLDRYFERIEQAIARAGVAASGAASVAVS